MVESHLLHAAMTFCSRPMPRAGRLVVFFALGAALLGAKRHWLDGSSVVRPRIEVRVPSSATDDDVEMAVRRALLSDYAVSRGALVTDPLARSQRAQWGQSAERPGEGPDDSALQRVDPVIRERLVFVGEQLLRQVADQQEPSETELSAYLRDHAERYVRPARTTLMQVLVSARRSDTGRRKRLAELGALLVRPLSSREAAAASDPSIVPRRLSRAAAHEIDAVFGQGFADALGAAPLGVWSGPLRSAYGEHFVFVEAREQAQVPQLSEVSADVRTDLLDDRRGLALTRALAQLRARYDVSITRDPS